VGVLANQPLKQQSARKQQSASVMTILDVTTDEQEIPPCNMIKWTQ
jgi:hypothetical protein